MIVAIIKIEVGLSVVQEFRNANNEETAISGFCNEYTPALNTADYLGVNADSLDLKKEWGWDFSKDTPTLEEIVPQNPMEEVYAQSEIDGREYFKFAKAKYFGVKLQSGELTYANLSYLYTRLSDVALRLNNGDQALALHYLQNEFGIITQTDIDNGYTQGVHDNIINDINNYLNQ